MIANPSPAARRRPHDPVASSTWHARPDLQALAHVLLGRSPLGNCGCGRSSGLSSGKPCLRTSFSLSALAYVHSQFGQGAISPARLRISYVVGSGSPSCQRWRLTIGCDALLLCGHGAVNAGDDREDEAVLQAPCHSPRRRWGLHQVARAAGRFPAWSFAPRVGKPNVVAASAEGCKFAFDRLCVLLGPPCSLSFATVSSVAALPDVPHRAPGAGS